MSHTKHILMLVNTHVYDDPRVVAEGLALIKRGYAVTIIGAARLGGVPARDTVGGLDIVLAPMITTYHPLRLTAALWYLLRGAVGTITDNPPSLQTNLISLIFFILWAIRLGWSVPAAVVHSHDLSPLPAAWLLSRLRRTRLVYDSHESAANFYSGRKGQMMAWLERKLIGKADQVITVGERLAADLRTRGARQVTIIGNWKNLNLFSIDPSRLSDARQRMQLSQYELVVVFIGDLTPTIYQLQPLLDALTQMPHVTLLIGGRGALQDTICDLAEHHPNIQWLGYVNYADVPLYTTLADVAYCCISAEFVQARYVVPNKLFEAFAAGKALIARRGVGEMSEILAKFPAALLLDTVTTESLRDAFAQLRDKELLADLQRQAQAASLEYNWEAAETRLYALYEGLVNAPQSH